MHPIVSSISTYNYHLSRFLTGLFDPIIPTFHCTKDSLTFCEEIQKLSAINTVFISYDVCSLFTNIPLKETIDIVVNLLFEHNLRFGITKTELKNIRYIFSFSGYISQPNRCYYHGFSPWSCHG